MKIVKLTQIFISLFFMISMEAFSQDYSLITQGIDTITGSGLPGPIFPMESNVVPLVSGNLLSSDCGFSIYSVATLFGKGRVIAIGHEGMLSDGVLEKYDNQRFLVNSMKWLNSDKKRILIKNGWLNDGNLKTLKSDLISEGYTITSTNNNINSSDLTNIDIILFGNDWNNGLPYSETEVEKIKTFVENGGGIFITGLGWSFSNLEQYAMNSISKVFGFKYVNSAMYGTPFFTEFYPKIQNLTISGSINNLGLITKEYSSSLPSVLQNNSLIKEDFTKANIYLKYAVEFLPLNSRFRDSIYSAYIRLIKDNPSLYQKGKTYNISSETAMIWNRERMYNNLQASKELSMDVITEIGKTLGLNDDYLEIWERHQVLLLDNSQLDVIQLKFVKDLLNSIPNELHNLRSISFAGYLGNTNTISLGNNNFGGVNTFSTPIGQYPENQFPNDVTPGITAIFCAATAHEINHVVNAYYIANKENLSNRQTQLINQAGTVNNNYLRGSNSPAYSDFFVNAPQEFFASISNQWFTDSEKVLRLGLIRFDKDYKEPINQFLFYADVYSLGSDSTIFYKNDLNGNFSSYKVPIKRDNYGNINQIEINDSLYNFQLDSIGNVTGYTFKLLTAVKQIPNNNSIQIFPNPASSYVIINTGNYKSLTNYSICIRDMIGHQVFKTLTNEQEIRIDVSSFGGNGIYVVEIIDNSNRIITTRKIIIQ